jgi:outer membrane protein insertion porin family
LAISAGLSVGLILGAASVADGNDASPITVEGNRRLDADMIRSQFAVGRGGRQLDAAAIDAGLKALYATGQFQDVRVTRTGERLTVSVVENPLIGLLRFEGNKKIKDDQLKTGLQSRAGGPLSRPAIQGDVIRIVDAYHKAGYFDARVEPKIINQPKDRTDLVFEIHEGEKTGIKEITFVGNKSYSALRLRQVIRSGVSNPLSFLMNNDIYDPDRVEADREMLRTFYLTHGYFDVRIISGVATYHPDRKGFVVVFTLDEGALYRFGTVDIKSSISSADVASLRSVLRTAGGAVFNVEAVQQSTERLAMEIARRGDAFATVRPRLDHDEKARVINVVYAIEDGPHAYVERINIKGNNKTRDSVIRREFDFAEGDAYNLSLVDRAERRLKNLGYFKTVKITKEPGSAPDRIMLDVQVEEQSTGEFTISGGYSTADGWIAEIGIGDHNFLGSGRYVKASVAYGQNTSGFNIGVVEPFLLGNRISLSFDAFGKQSVASTYQSFGSGTYGATAAVGLPLTDQLAMQWRYSIYRQSITLDPALMDCSPGNPPPGCYANGEASIPIKQAVLNGPAWVSSAGYSLTYNTLDNVKNPHNGLRSEFRQDLAGLGGDVKFLKSTEDARYYHEMAGDSVGMLRAQGGYVTPWGGQTLPFMNGFFGGPQLVRGFAPNGFGPRDTTPGTTMDNVGGTSYWATTAEMQSPIPLLPPELGLKAAAFADAGSVWGYNGFVSGPSLGQSLQVSGANVIRSSVGVGLVWDSPFGPLRVDYALPTSKASSDVTQRLRFGVGAF